MSGRRALPRALPAIALALLLLAPGAARAERIVVEPSTDAVNITSNFAGASIAVFGVIERDAMTVSRPGGYDVAVTVRGPDQRLLVQRKDRIAGVWVNATAQPFTEVPSFFAIATTRPVADFAHGIKARELTLGLEYVGHAGEIRGVRAAREPFREALVRLREASGLYRADARGVEFRTDEFFRARFELPSAVRDGTYRIDAHLFAGETLLSSASASFRVEKVGFEQAIFDLAMDRPLLYGLGVVAVALLLGYVGGLVFRRG